jgi:hypothetical protein
MRRPSLLRAFAFLLLGLHACTALAAPQVDGRQVRVPAADAQQFLDGRFPHRQDMLGGLAEVTVSRPRLAIPPGDRMQLGLDVALATAGGTPVPMGQLVLTSALRYDTAQRALFLEQPRIEAFHPTGGGEGLDQASRSLLNAWLVDYSRREPVYRIDPALAALVGGLDVSSAGVEDGQLVVTFNQDIGAMAGAMAPAESD